MSGPHRNHVEMIAKKIAARQYVSETHDHKPDARERSDLTIALRMVLRKILDEGSLDLRCISEWHRQRCIDLAMHEPPLTDVDADRVFLTPEGKSIAARDKSESLAERHGHAASSKTMGVRHD